MKKKLPQILLAAFLAGTAQIASAINYTNTDLLLVFRDATSNHINDVEYDVGSVSNYLGLTAGTVVPISYDTNLVTTNAFGGSLTNVRLAALAATELGNPSGRVWASDASLAVTASDVTSSKFGVLRSKIQNVGDQATLIAPSGGTTDPLVIAPTSGSSYSFIVSGGSSLNNPPTGVANWAGDLAFNTDSQTPATVALYEIHPSGTTPKPPATLIGAFTMKASGEVYFTAGGLAAILASPTSQTNSFGQTATFSVSTAGGVPAPSFQWYQNGTAIGGATSSTLTLNNALGNNGGQYTVVVSNASGSVTSSVATLSFKYSATDLALVFRDGTTNHKSDILYDLGSVSNYLGLAVGTVVPISYDLNRVTTNGFGGSLTNVRVGLAAATGLGDPVGRFWASDSSLTVVPTDVTGSKFGVVRSKIDNAASQVAGLTFGSGDPYPLVILPTSANSYSFIVSGGSSQNNPPTGVANMAGDMAFNVDAANPSTLAVYEVHPSGTTPKPPATLIGALQWAANGDLKFVAGVIPPVINTQPNSETNGTRNTATFNVAAVGSSVLHYQWFKDDTNSLPGETNASLVIENLQLANAGGYSVLITNAGGSITSSVATLTVFGCPDITVSPAMLPYGASNVFYTNNISASGSPATPYTFTATGSLPPGITLSSDGALSGTSTAPGLYTFTVVATDTNGCTGLQAYGVRITGPCADATPPLAPSFTFPKTGKPVFSTVNANPVTLSGKIVDETAADQLLVSLNGAPFQLASVLLSKPASGTWSIPLSLRAGYNNVQIITLDACGNASPTVTNIFPYQVPVALTIITNGHGTTRSKTFGFPTGLYIEQPVVVSALADGAKEKIGSLNLFSNWVVLSNGNPIITSTVTKSFGFTMQSNTTLVANYVTNLFIDAGGVYYGLFANTNGVTHETAGFITFKTTSKQGFTGVMYVQGEKVKLTGIFDLLGDGALTKPAYRAGLSNKPFDVNIHVDLTGGKLITGTISNNVEGWTASIDADQYVYNPKAVPTPTPPAFALTNYTVIIPGSPGDSSRPAGDGYMILAVGTDGMVKAKSGYTGDGQKIKALAAPVSQDGLMPFYTPLYAFQRTPEAPVGPAITKGVYKGAMMGWLSLSTANVECTNLVWIDTGWTNALYPAGFTNGPMTVLASTFQDTGGKQLDMTNATVTLTDGNLSGSITNGTIFYDPVKFKLVTQDPGNKTANLISLKFSAKGEFGGSFLSTPGDKASKKVIKGAMLQNGNGRVSRGFFLGTTQSGAATLTPNP